jgi:hypothetical protein
MRCQVLDCAARVAGTWAAVNLRWHALKGAVRRNVGAAAAAKEVASYTHAGGGYAFRRRKLPAGALAEPSAAGDDPVVCHST